MSTAEAKMSKRLYRLRVLSKAVLFTTRSELRRYAMRHYLYVLQQFRSKPSGRGGLTV
jgi:hypothetical protein